MEKMRKVLLSMFYRLIAFLNDQTGTYIGKCLGDVEVEVYLQQCCKGGDAYSLF